MFGALLLMSSIKQKNRSVKQFLDQNEIQNTLNLEKKSNLRGKQKTTKKHLDLSLRNQLNSNPSRRIGMATARPRARAV